MRGKLFQFALSKTMDRLVALANSVFHYKKKIWWMKTYSAPF